MLFNPKRNSTLSEMLAVSQLINRPASIFSSLPSWFCQVIRFGLVGILNTFVDTALYFLLSRSGLIVNLFLAKGISYNVGILNSFFWNKSWTFKSKVESRKTFIPFVIVSLLAIGINVGVLHLAMNTFGLAESGALAAATLAIFVWNFAASKFIVFK
jgi:putative flippase GtrA